MTILARRLQKICIPFGRSIAAPERVMSESDVVSSRAFEQEPVDG